MIRLLFILGIMLAPATAAEVSLRWDANREPGVRYRVWRGIDIIADVDVTSLTIDLPINVRTTLTLTAYIGYMESEHTAPLTIEPMVVSTSGDLKTWSRAGITWRKVPAGETRRFYRISYPTAD